MKFAIISDVHSNLEALEVVLSHAGDLQILCLGDIVGYGAQPNECVDLVRARAAHVVMGNHDIACGDGTGVEGFNPSAMMSAVWTNRELTQSNIDWLLTLPYTVTQPSFALVHGSPEAPEDFNYVLDTRDANRAFKSSLDAVTFIGHSHYPCVFKLCPTGAIETLTISGDMTLTIAAGVTDGSRYVVNVGSVGQPRDSDTRASYVVFDDEAKTLTWHRLDYNVAAAQAKIRATTLPARCADRIGEGR